MCPNTAGTDNGRQRSILSVSYSCIYFHDELVAESAFVFAVVHGISCCIPVSDHCPCWFCANVSWYFTGTLCLKFWISCYFFLVSRCYISRYISFAAAFLELLVFFFCPACVTWHSHTLLGSGKALNFTEMLLVFPRGGNVLSLCCIYPRRVSTDSCWMACFC